MSILLLIVIIYPIATGLTTTQAPLATFESDYILIAWPNKQMNWISAESYCQDTYDSDLATILTNKQYDLISNYSTSMAMIGLKQNASNGKWSWINAPITDKLFYCSLLISTSGQYHIQPIDCNTPYNQFYCNNVRGYIYISDPKTLFDAEEHCKKQYGTHLATITQYKDIQNALELISNNSVWIGLYSNNEYDIWLDTTQYISEYMTHFIAFNGHSNCRTLNGHNTLIGNDYNCDILLPFLCNKRSKPREYMLYKQRKTYIEAQQFCVETLDTELATVITEEEFSNAMRLIPESKGAWIGLKKEYEEGLWYWNWIDGTECTQHDVCIPYWLQNDVITEPVYQCGWLWQHGRARTAICTEEMEYVLCNKPKVYYQIERKGDVIMSDKEIVIVSDIVNKRAHNEDLNILSEKTLHHGKVMYYLYPERPYDATYKIPANWIVIAGYIGIGAIALSGVLCCVLFYLFLREPIPIDPININLSCDVI